MNTDEIKRNTDIVEIIGQDKTLKKVGSEWKAQCPWHDDKNPSLTISPKKQIYWCPVCDKPGDVFDWLQEYRGMTFKEAAEYLKPVEHKAVAIIPTEPKSTPPIPENAELVTQYAEWFYVVRMEGKKIRPLTHTDQGWIWKRPTIQLPMFSAGEGEKVLCEGEKACMAASESYHAHCWHGGTNSITKTDFEGVGNDWLFWPDNDLPGWVAMQSIALMYGVNPRFITAPPNSEKGYDAADGDAGEVIRLTDLTQVKNPLTGEVERWLTLKDGRVNVSKEPPTPEPVTPRFFVPLGFDKQSMSVYYYFYIRGKNKAVAFSAAQLLQKSALYDLNPDANYWISRYGEGKKIDTDQAATHLMNVCEAVGLFSPDKIRTRGAWMDRGRVVLHVGPYLIVDGKRTDIAELDTEYVYEWRDDLHYEPGEPLRTDTAREFCDMLKLYNWERDVNAELLTGWCAIAPLCGALPWRPHIWITGSSGTGKTKLMKDTILPLMSSIAVTPEGESTEAGIRQHLDGDALPVLFDEAESENRRSQERMEGILNLMRSASSGKSGQILKGSSSHHARSFRVRSCFGFASIVYQATKKADRSRITVLGLRRAINHKQQVQRWDLYNDYAVKMINDDFIAAFHARSITMLPKILESAKVFASSVSEVLSDRRSGDQIGTMLAGYWMLTHDDIPTRDEADAYVNSRDWSEETDQDDEADEKQCLRTLLQRVELFEGDGYRAEASIGELVSMALDNDEAASKKLARCGFKVDSEALYVANNSEWIKKALSETAWGKNHAKILSRLDDAKRLGPMYFAPGITSRAVRINLENVK